MELRLWRKWWKIGSAVALVLSALSILGFLGLKYYINNEGQKRFASAVERLSDNSERLIATGRLLFLLESAYGAKNCELRNEVLTCLDRTRAALAQARAEKTVSISQEDLQITFDFLTDILSGDRFTRVESRYKRASRPPGYPSTKGLNRLLIGPPQMIIQKSAQLDVSFDMKRAHPINDGSLGGAVTYIKFRYVHLVAFADAIEDVRKILASKELLKEHEATIATEYEFVFVPKYVEYLDSTKAALLSDDEKRILKENEELYMIDYVVPGKGRERAAKPYPGL